MAFNKWKQFFKKHDAFAVALFALLTIPIATNAQTVVPIVFPLDVDPAQVDIQDTFGAPRGSRLHEGVDIMTEKMTPILAAASGVVTFAPMQEPSYGYMITINGDDGHKYNYVHINNDTPGTDDGAGGPENAYAPGIQRGSRVQAGQLIGWAGDSGNAEEVGSHLHFEIRTANDVAIDPYPSILAAIQGTVRVIDYDREVELERASTISRDKNLAETNNESVCETNALVRTHEVSTVYYCGSDGGRYAFQDEGTYFSWFEDFDAVQFISTEEMASMPLKGIVTYRPGRYLVKIQTDPKVYAIAANGELRWVRTTQIAESLYGDTWAKQVRDIPDSLFPRYTIGNPIE